MQSSSDPTPAGESPAASPANASDQVSETSSGGASQATLADRLATAEREATEFKDQFLRARAEMENLRRRTQEDIAKAHKYSIESLASALLPVKDSLEAALATESPSSLEAIRSGVELTLKQLTGVFEKTQLREVNPAGAKFDPHYHQAISTLASDQEPNTVINVLQKGYVLHDRVIRPALVTVAKAKDA